MSEPRRSARLAATTATTAKTDTEVVETTPAKTPVLASIDIGDTLPSYILKNEQGEDIDVAKLTEEKGVVIFSIPKADTSGCTTQACGFRDIYPDFTEHNFTVYCLSHDKPEDQKKWQLKVWDTTILNSRTHCCPDPDRVFVAALGAKDPKTGKTKRGHFIFAKGGKLVDKKLPVSPADSPTFALEFVKSSKPAL
ncbi:peroxiredoxin Q [Lactarius sanguifluus]|nr:peroxiredoxin Q [Lactarius sanguifluus]